MTDHSSSAGSRRFGVNWAAMTYCVVGVSMAASSQAAELPVPCVAGSCGPLNTSNTFVSSGAATAVVNGSTMNVNQTTSSAVLNWRSFNISADGTVNFIQPDAAATAINRIFDIDVSRINGALNANGRVYLLNQNGILFGGKSQLNVGGLLASSLDLTNQALELGLARAATAQAPALDSVRNGQLVPRGDIVIEQGAQLRSEGGQILVFAPNVTNRGTIEAPDGQVILGAGERVFLTTSESQDLRGLLVEVGNGGTVTNGEDANAGRSVQDIVGSISADRGNVTLAGLAVNQQGRVSATTSVRANGSIRLLARDFSGTTLGTIGGALERDRTGELRVGEGSLTQVALDDDDATTVDANEQLKSSIELEGHSVEIQARAAIRAPSGRVSIVARTNPNADPAETGFGQDPDDSRLLIHSGAEIDVSGASTQLAMERNSLRVELRGSQLADSPQQRDGALRGQPVFIDVRRYGTRADGTAWVGTPLADVSGDIGTIAKDVRERNLSGGDISLISQGAVLVDDNARLDVSGGFIDWQSGTVRTTQLLGVDGRVYDIGDAPREQLYVGTADQLKLSDARWGTDRTYRNLSGTSAVTVIPGYVEGKDAGSVSIQAPRAVVDGDIVAERVVGPNQRLAPTAVSSGQLYRGYDQLPLGGRLSLSRPAPGAGDNNYLLHSVTIGAGPSLASYTNPDGSAVDWLNDPLPEDLTTLWLRPELFGEGRITRLQAFMNNDFTLADGVNLSMPGASSIEVTAGRVDVEGSIRSTGGNVRLDGVVTSDVTGVSGENQPSVTIGHAATIDVSGGWVNERSMGFERDTTSPLLINGGTVSVTSRPGSVDLQSGSVIDVSGGARMRSNNSVTAGTGGAVTLAARAGLPGDVTPLHLDGELRGFGLSRGGTLNLAASSVCIATADCGGDEALTLGPERFASGGFSRYSVTATDGNLTVLSGTELRPQQSNYVLRSSALTAASGTDFDSLVDVALLADHLRQPTHLALAANAASNSVFVDYGDVRVEEGASLLLEPGASLSLTSNSRLLIDGQLQSRGGTIDLGLTNTLAGNTFRADQGIWLGDHARLDVSGISLFEPTNDLGLRTGEVLNGGTINITAQRGYVVTLAGSRLDVSGASGEFDTPTGPGTFATQQIHSAAGTINLTAADGMLLNGTLIGRSDSPEAARGSLNVRLDASTRGGDAALDFPQTSAARSIVVADAHAPTIVAPGTAIPTQLHGQALVSSSAITEGGFDFVSLGVANVRPPGTAGTQLSLGSIVLDGGAALAPRVRLTLDAPNILVRGSEEVSLSSAVVRLGASGNPERALAAPTAGEGTLRVRGDLVELFGDVSISGVRNTQIASSGDIRFRGVSVNDPTSTTGGRVLHSAVGIAGDVELSADQIYATTLTRASLDVADGALSLTSADNANVGTVLSAASQLSLSAQRIDVATSVLAPYGALRLDADEINILDGGTLSTSTDQLIPFGRIQGGFAWVYEEAPGGLTHVYTSDESVQLPAQSIELNAEQLSLSEGGRIDFSGGGDLLAFEWQPGPGGTADILDQSVDPNLFAIVPGLDIEYAPFDPREYAGSTLQPGNRIHLDGTTGLPAGDYTLLPARYALLPGAFTVKAVSGFTDLPPGQGAMRLDGASLVSGYRTQAGTPIRDARSSGFLVSPSAVYREQAQYVTATANTFLGDLEEEALSTRPRDAGSLSITAGTSLNLASEVRGQAATDGRGGRLDIAADNLRVTGSGTAPSSDWVDISDDQLSRLAVDSILLGGSRELTPDGLRLQTESDVVRIASGAMVSAREILVTAGESIEMESGATVAAASGGAPVGEMVAIDGNAALLRVSSGEQIEVERTGAPSGSAAIRLDAGSTLRTAGSITLDAIEAPTLDGTIDAHSASLRIGANTLRVASTSVSEGQPAVSASALNAIGLGELQLVARDGLLLDGSFDLTVPSLSLSAPEVRAIDAAGQVNLTGSDRVLLAGIADHAVVPATTAPATGSLTINSNRLELGEGSTTINGIGSVSLLSSAPIRVGADGALIASGDLNLGAGLLVAEAGIDYRVAAGNALSLTGAGTAADVPNAALGGRLDLEARTISVAGLIAAPSGQINLTAQDSLSLAAGALVDVSGRRLVFDERQVDAPAGTMQLTSFNGNVEVLAGASLRADAGAAGDAGAIDIRAANGTLILDGALSAAANGGAGGRLSLDASALNFFAAMNAASSGGFTDTVAVRQRGAGNFLLAADQTVRAEHVALTADRGAIQVDGRIDASSSGGGRVVLSARDLLTVNGTIDAHATGNEIASRATVELQSATGVRLANSSVLDVRVPQAPAGSDENRGSVLLRMPRAAVLSALSTRDRFQLAGSILGAQSVVAEGYATYVDTDVDFADVLADVSNPLYAQASQFMTDASGVAAALGQAADGPFHVRPGVEIATPGDLHVSADWNLHDWRFGDQPGVLTLRAGGDLLVDRSISDGFASLDFTNPDAFTLPTTPTPSWSLRLAAGADTSSANALGLRAPSVTATGGSVVLAPGSPGLPEFGVPGDPRVIRTGTGDIDIAAARDLVLGNQASVIYTAGVSGPGVFLPGDPTGFVTGTLGLGLAYPTAGGDIRIDAGGDIAGAPSTQLIGEWQRRVGCLDVAICGAIGLAPTAWSIAFDRFEQGIGVLGGGNVSISAGGSVRDLWVHAPSIGRQVGGTAPEDNEVQVGGGGSIAVHARGDFDGGGVHVGRGRAQLDVGGSIGRSSTDTVRPDAAPILALGDAQIALTSRDDLTAYTAVNPTLLESPFFGVTSFSWFSTYAADSVLSLLSAGGSVQIGDERLSSNDPGLNQQRTFAALLAPPTLRLISASADVNIGDSMGLAPSPRGTLELLAAHDVTFESTAGDGGASIVLSDMAAGLIPSPQAPDLTFSGALTIDTPWTALLTNPINTDARFFSPTPIHSAAGSADGIADAEPTHIVARDGDIRFVADGSGIFSAKRVRLTAGRDVLNPLLVAQHVAPGDVSSIVAGRDIRNALERGPAGNILSLPAAIEIGGPGHVELIAGRDVDFQTARGLTTEGNSRNPFLDDSGASISITAGLQGREPAYDAFIAKYLDEAAYDKMIVDYMQQTTGQTQLGAAAARAQFRELPRASQRPLLERILIAELRAGGRSAAQPGPTNKNFERAFAALETYFPGSNPDVEAGETSPYSGDIRLYFSRAYTLAGGDISLFAPGGEINAGLATPPSAYGVTKEASQLGVVVRGTGDVNALAYSDFLVNESRVFAADGGNILVWSTRGDIDAGRGAKTAISAPPPQITFDENGQPKVVFQAAFAGSGIQTIATTEGRKPGDVDLFAPRGVVNAGDAGIVAGNLTIAATAVLGADNIQASGVTVGVPVDASGLGASLSSVSAAAGSAASAATSSIDPGAENKEQQPSMAQAALSWLEVFVVGLGEEGCRPDDVDCLKRQK